MDQMDEATRQNISTWVYDYDRKNREAWGLGQDLAAQVPPQDGIGSISFDATAMAGFLYQMASRQSDDECTSSLLEWTFERFWGQTIQPLLAEFRHAWEWLRKHHSAQSNALMWGDVDYFAWTEPTRDEHLRVIALKVACAARDDNIYLFIDNSPFPQLQKFHVRTCWPRETKSRYNMKRNPWDEIELPSLATYRRMDFKPRYGDSRDRGYGLSYDYGNVDSGFSSGATIQHSIRELRGLLATVKDARHNYENEAGGQDER